MRYIIQDRYGYWEVVEAADPDEAVRTSSNLAAEANLDYASTSFVGAASKFTEEQFHRHNCEVAMDYGMECQCGFHKD